MAKAIKKQTPKARKFSAKSTKSTAEKVETNLIRRLTVKPKNKNIQEFHPGDTVNVFVKIKEGDKERVQLYKGVVTKLQGSGAARSFTVRKISAGIGVERTFPFSSPIIDKVEIVNHGMVRRAKLYYLRSLEGKASKIESQIAIQPSTSSAE